MTPALVEVSVTILKKLFYLAFHQVSVMSGPENFALYSVSLTLTSYLPGHLALGKIKFLYLGSMGSKISSPTPVLDVISMPASGTRKPSISFC